MKPPFASTALLLCLHAPNLHEQLHSPTTPPTPALDLIASQGATTAITLTSEEKNLPAITPHLFHLARTNLQRNPHLLTCTQAENALPNLSPGLHFINVPAAELSRADNLASLFIPHLSQTCIRNLTRSSNNSPCVTALGMLGILCTGHGDWAPMLPSPVAHFHDLLPIPPQTCQFDHAERSLAGFVTWYGSGLVRTDTRTSIRDFGPPGEGCLDLFHVVQEMLGKTGLIDRYGA